MDDTPTGPGPATTGPLVVGFEPRDDDRRRIRGGVGDGTDVVFLTDLDRGGRLDALEGATVLLSRHTARELDDDEHARLGRLLLVQFLTAGVDHIPVHRLPASVPVAVNAGAYAEPMAEHALALILAAFKRLLPGHEGLGRGDFDQFTPNRLLRGATVGIVGFGGIGVAVSRLLRPLGVRVHALNRRGATDEPVDRIDGVEGLDELLATVDVVVLSVPLTARTERLIGERELALMKPDAVLVNLARGEIVDEDALWSHLRENTAFTACLDAWWVEPIRHGEFRMDRPFTRLPNVIGSPHNSASVGGWRAVALDRALENCRRALDGGEPRHLIGDDERAWSEARWSTDPQG